MAAVGITKSWVSTFEMLCQAFPAASFSCCLFVGLSVLSFKQLNWAETRWLTWPLKNIPFLCLEKLLGCFLSATVKRQCWAKVESLSKWMVEETLEVSFGKNEVCYLLYIVSEWHDLENSSISWQLFIFFAFASLISILETFSYNVCLHICITVWKSSSNRMKWERRGEYKMLLRTVWHIAVSLLLSTRLHLSKLHKNSQTFPLL